MDLYKKINLNCKSQKENSIDEKESLELKRKSKLIFVAFCQMLYWFLLITYDTEEKCIS